MINLDWTIVATGVVFLLTAWMLNKLLFQPLLATLAERRARTVDLEGAAGDTLEKRQTLFDEYSEKIKAEKQRGYQLAESARQEALEGRQKELAAARDRADDLLSTASSEVVTEIRKAEQGLRGEVEELAALIAARALRQS